MAEVSSIDPALSPFDAAGVQFAWDSTSLGWLKTCPRLYQLSMLEGWRPKHISHHLTFGIHYHHGLEWYDHAIASGAAHEDAVRTCVRRLLEATWDRDAVDLDGHPAPGPWQSGDANKNRFTLIRSVVWYLERFGASDPATTLILANGKPAVELSFRFEVRPELFLCGHLDRVAEFGGQAFVFDRKTAKAGLTPSYFRQYDIHNQMTLYTLAGKVAFDLPVKGVIIDATQIGVGFNEYARYPTHRTPAQLEEFVDGLEAFRTQAEFFTEAEFWPMNETACDKFGGCTFREVCNKDPSMRRQFLQTYFTQEVRWNPLQPR